MSNILFAAEHIAQSAIPDLGSIALRAIRNSRNLIVAVVRVTAQAARSSFARLKAAARSSPAFQAATQVVKTYGAVKGAAQLVVDLADHSLLSSFHAAGYVRLAALWVQSNAALIIATVFIIGLVAYWCTNAVGN